MSKLPRVDRRQSIAALRPAGFKVIRTKGSRHFLQHPDGRSTVVPVHAGEGVGPGLLLAILCDGELARANFPALLYRGKSLVSAGRFTRQAGQISSFHL